MDAETAPPPSAARHLQLDSPMDIFWLVNPCLYDFSASSHPATLPDALSSPEAPPAQPKAPAPISCLLDTLKFDGAGWGVRRRVRYIGRPRDASKEASIGGYETEASAKEQLPPAPEDKRSSISGKRKRDGADTSNDKPSTETRAKKKTYRSPKKQKKRHVESKDGDPRRGKDRWSAERSLLEIMRSIGARIGASVMRQALREEARKRIGDTGLLDHLLKHMAGRVPDGSTDRFRRRHNADGAMEYWLEPADLAEVRREAGVSDPYWVPPPGWKPGDDVSPAAGDLLIKRQVEELTDELNDVKRHMEQLSSNMVELGKEAKSEAERAYSSWKEKYHKVAKANEKLEKQVLSLKRPQVIKFCYRKRPTGHSRSSKDDSSQDPKTQSPSSPLSRQSLSTPVIPTYHAGGFYEIDHERLPPRTPIHLKSIRVVNVSEYTSLGITVSFPSPLALRSFSLFPASSNWSDLGERFVMNCNHAVLILRCQVAEDSFWLVNPCLHDFNASSHPATLPDALSSPEAPPASISCLLNTLNQHILKRPQVIKFCYRKRPTCHSRNCKDDSSQDPKTQSPSSPLSRQSLSTPAIPTYHAGGFYEIDHERLPPRTPINLKSIRVVKELKEEMHQDSLCLVSPCLYDFSASCHPAVLPDMMLSPEAPPANAKVLPMSYNLDTLKFDGTGLGRRRHVRMARSLFVLLLVMCMILPTVGSSTSNCNSGHLAELLLHNCNSTERTMDCCEPIVFAIDVGGGVDCLCLVSQNPSVIDRGHTFKDLLVSYVDCGGLHPEAFHHATNTGYCAGPAASPPPPPQQYDHPPPSTSAASSVKPAAIASYWDEWNKELAALGLPSPMTMIEGAFVALLVYVGRRFQAYLQLLLRRVVRWVAGLFPWGGNLAREQIVNRVELALFAQDIE